jgi:arylsulfatase A-like enzyme
MKVLVLVARGLQAGAVGAYGNLWVETPALDRLAAEGVVFDQHCADHASPEGARRAWRSGRYYLPAPPDLGPSAPEPPPDLLDSLRRRGVRTCLVLDASRPAPADFAAGWDRVERLAAEGEAGPLEATLGAAQEVLGQLAGESDWLLWVDLATPLPPWHVPDEFQEPYFSADAADEDEQGEEEDAGEEEEEGEPLTPLDEVAAGPVDPADDTLFLRLRSSYAAAVTYLDAGVGGLLDALVEAGGAEDVVVLFTSDCGQALGEHGVVGPVRAWAHDEVLHLPLLLRLPGADEAGRRVSALTQAVDLAPTLADIFEVPLPDAHGHSLLPLVYGEVEAVRPYACAGLEAGPAVEWALRTPEWAFLLPVQPHPDDPARGPQLYVKPDDRWEVNNVCQHHLELVEHLEQTLRDFVAATRRPGPLRVPPLRDMEAAGDPAGRAPAGEGHPAAGGGAGGQQVPQP